MRTGSRDKQGTGGRTAGVAVGIEVYGAGVAIGAGGDAALNVAARRCGAIDAFAVAVLGVAVRTCISHSDFAVSALSSILQLRALARVDPALISRSASVRVHGKL